MSSKVDVRSVYNSLAPKFLERFNLDPRKVSVCFDFAVVYLAKKSLGSYEDIMNMDIKTFNNVYSICRLEDEMDMAVQERVYESNN